jgi:hypothetical protein
MFLSIAFNVPRIFQYDIVWGDDDSSHNSFVFSNCTTSATNCNTLTVTATPTPSMEWAYTDANQWTTAAAAGKLVAASGRRFPTFRLSALGSNAVFEVIYSNAFYSSVVLIFPLVLLVGVNAKLIRELQVC